jgi:hypothetical protein
MPFAGSSSPANFLPVVSGTKEVGCGFLLGQYQIPCHAEYTRAQAGVAWTLLEDGAQAGKPAFGERVTEPGESQMVLITGEKQLTRFGQGLL